MVSLISIKLQDGEYDQQQNSSKHTFGEEARVTSVQQFELETWDPIAGQELHLLPVVFAELTSKSGLSFYYTQQGQLKLFCITHLSNVRTFNCLSLPDDDDGGSSQRPNGRTHELDSPEQRYAHTLNQYRSAYGREYGVGDVSVTKTWGLTCSSLSYSAICFSIHPKDMVEYITPGNEQSTIAFISTQFEGTGNTVVDILEDPNGEW